MSLSRRFLIFPLILSLLLTPITVAHDDIDIVSLAQSSRDAVVSVRGVASVNRTLGSRGQPPSSDFFSPFPRGFFERGRPQRRQPKTSIGSGFIIDGDGYILTNAHVIDGVDDIVVSLANGNEYKAEVIGSDELTDIAVIKIDTDDVLSAISIGDSEKVLVGQSVLAIGSPYGLDQTVTSGIISALGRRLPRENYVPFIQTDAAVNPGNSGGPLINASGQVIGINSQIISPVQAFAGVSFAIPINVAIDIQQRLREDGFIRRGRLGVYFKPVTHNEAEVFGLDKPQGALIQEVVEGSTADEAGVQSGDVLLSFNGVDIDDSADLPSIIGAVEPGSIVSMEVLREGKRIILSAELGEIESEVPAQALLGLRVENMSEQLQQKTGISQGVQVIDIEFDDDTPAGMAQLRPGDIITHIFVEQRQYTVSDKKGLAMVLRNVSGGAIALRVWRNGRRLIFTVDIDG